VVLYLLAIMVALHSPRITEALFVAPRVLSLIPERRIEKRLVRHQPLAIWS
jgi:hypothetical protein